MAPNGSILGMIPLDMVLMFIFDFINILFLVNMPIFQKTTKEKENLVRLPGCQV